MKTHKILTVSALALAAQIGIAGAMIVVVEDFDSLDPTTDASGAGSGTLGGQGQLEDITSTTWSGNDSDTADLESRVLGTGDRNVRLRGTNATFDRLVTSSTFAVQNETVAFSFFFNVEGYVNGVRAGRLQLGLRNSVTDRNVFGFEFLDRYNSTTTMQMNAYEWDGLGNANVNATEITGFSLGQYAGTGIGSIELAYDGVDTLSYSVYAGANRTGTVLTTDSGVISLTSFEVDSLFIQQTQAVASNTRYLDITVDDLSVDIVPEPSTGALLGLAGLALILRRRK